MKVKSDDVQRVLLDVRQMKGKQENINSKLETLKRYEKDSARGTGGGGGDLK